jgi:hypothetical protein
VSSFAFLLSLLLDYLLGIDGDRANQRFGLDIGERHGDVVARTCVGVVVGRLAVDVELVPPATCESTETVTFVSGVLWKLTVSPT